MTLKTLQYYTALYVVHSTTLNLTEHNV